MNDRLGNFIPAVRRDSYIMGFRRSAFGVAAGPRASVEVRPIERLSLMVAYGEGYRSPQARLLHDGESAPFTKVRSGDVGFRLRLGDADELSVTGTAFYTHLSNDIIFDPQQASFAAIGPSTRVGGVLTVRTQPWDWLFGQVSATFVHATIDQPPLATAENPTPAFTPGSLLPYVAPWVVRADVGAHHRLFDIDGHPVEGRAGHRIFVPLAAALALQPVRAAGGAARRVRLHALALAHLRRLGVQPPEHPVERDAVLLRLQLEPEPATFATPGAACHRRCAVDHHGHAGGDVVKLSRTLALLAVSLLGCGNTGQEVVSFPVHAAGTGQTSFEKSGWSVTLEQANIGFGPIWMCATPFGDVGVCDQAEAEWLGTTTVNALDPSLQMLGDANAVTGTVRSAIFDYGRSWLLTATVPQANDGAPGGHSARFVVRATNGSEALEIHLDIDVDPPRAGQTAVIAVPTGTHDITGTEALTVQFDPAAWWRGVDYDAVAALDTDGDGVVVIGPGDTPYNAIAIALTTQPVTFQWSQP